MPRASPRACSPRCRFPHRPSRPPRRRFLDQLRLFAEVFGQIKREYVEPVDDKKLLTAAIKGMVSSLDPHSSFLDKTDYDELQEQSRFAGLGIEISQEDGLVKVISPIEDTPRSAPASVRAT